MNSIIQSYHDCQLYVLFESHTGASQVFDSFEKAQRFIAQNLEYLAKDHILSSDIGATLGCYPPIDLEEAVTRLTTGGNGKLSLLLLNEDHTHIKIRAFYFMRLNELNPTHSAENYLGM